MRNIIHIAIAVMAVLAVFVIRLLLEFNVGGVMAVLIAAVVCPSIFLIPYFITRKHSDQSDNESDVTLIVYCPDGVQRGVRLGLLRESLAGRLRPLRSYGYVRIGNYYPFNIDVPGRIYKAPLMKSDEAVSQLGYTMCREYLKAFRDCGGIMDAGLYGKVGMR